MANNWGGLALRRFRRSLERGAESTDARHDACLACALHSSYHEQCPRSMACCARAHGARARPRYVSSPAAKKPGRRHRQRIGAHSRMQSFSHIMPYNFLYARCMACNMAEFEACRTRGSAHFFQRNWRAPGYVRRCARRIKQRTTARRCMAIVIYMYYQVRVI